MSKSSKNVTKSLPLSLQEIATQLKVAREARGYSQEEVARHINLPRPAISLIESGRRSVSSIELARLAELYQRPVSFFLQTKGNHQAEEESWGVLLRAESISKADYTALEAAHEFCKKYAALEQLVLGQIHFEIPEYHLSVRSRREESTIREGEYLAANERRRLGLGSAPVWDMGAVLEKQGIKVVKWHFPATSQVSGCFFFPKDVGPCIIVNPAHRQVRANFTAAHEYCHFLRDRHRLSAEACNLKKLITRREPYEVRANAFAAAFLMPEDGVEEYLWELGLTKRSPLGPKDVVLAQHYFGVSYLAMLYRLQNLGWLTEEDRNRLQTFQPTALACRLGLTIEHREEELPFPLRFLRLALEAYRKEEISLGKFAALLHISRQEAAEILKSLGIPLNLGIESKEELKRELKSA